jgi:hypothetical protein
LWYKKNKIIDIFDDFDRSLGLAFAAQPESMGIDMTERIIMYPMAPIANTVVARKNLMSWIKDVYEIGNFAQYRVDLHIYGPLEPVDLEGEDVDFVCFLVTIHRDLEAECNRAAEDCSSIMRWEFKQPVIEALLTPFSIFNYMYSGLELLGRA